jgi:hypothetical protein
MVNSARGLLFCSKFSDLEKITFKALSHVKDGWESYWDRHNEDALAP